MNNNFDNNSPIESNNNPGMTDQLFLNKKWKFALLTICAYCILSFIAPIIYQIILMVIYGIFTNGDLTSEDALIFYSSYTHIITYTILTPVIILLSIFSIKEDIFKFKNQTNIIKAIISIVAAPIAMYLAMFIGSIIMELLHLNDTSDNQKALNSVLYGPYKAGIILTVVLMAPIIEELVFRKAIHTAIKPSDKSTAFKIIRVLVSGFCFGMLHVVSPMLQYLLAGEFLNSVLALLQVFPYLVMGLVFGAVYEINDGNVFPGIVIHAIWNTISILATYLLK